MHKVLFAFPAVVLCQNEVCHGKFGCEPLGNLTFSSGASDSPFSSEVVGNWVEHVPLSSQLFSPKTSVFWTQKFTFCQTDELVISNFLVVCKGLIIPHQKTCVSARKCKNK